MVKEKFNICFIANGNRYIIECGIVIVSILMNSESDERFAFHIISEDITDDDKNKFIQLKEIKDFDIYFYKPNVEKYKKWVEESKGKITRAWSHHVFLKLEIMNILKDLDKVLFLDVDTLVLKSLKDIFNTNMNNYYLIAAESDIDYARYVREIDGYKKLGISSKNIENHFQKLHQSIDLMMKNIGILDKKSNEWVNSGFMYMNLKLIKEIMTEETVDNYFIQLINSDIDCFGHEAFLNYFIPNDKILRVSESYNATMAMWRKEECCDIHIAHFTGGTILGSVFGEIMPEYKNKLLLYGWKYLSYTPWYKENPFYYNDLFSRYNNIRIDKKINKIVDIIVWLIPSKKMRDKFREKLKKMIEEASI